MWTLILAVLWYHAPALETASYASQSACETAGQAAIKAFSSDGYWVQGADLSAKYVCTKSN